VAKKEELFSKLNIKDYNNLLENILEKKSFTEGTKNILLNILYKIETSYEDYSKVKVFVLLKKELLEEIIKIIENDCNEIEMVKPKLNEETKLGDKKYIIEKDNNKIISYPNEKNVFYALNQLNNRFCSLNIESETLKKPIEKFLNQGYIMDKQEILRDFDGWTWNIIADEIDNFSYNIMYQNIRILLGNEFFQNHIDNIEIEFIKGFEDKIKEKFEKENSITKLIYQIAILEYLKKNENIKEHILKTKQDLEQQLNEMNNKKQYLQSIANNKKIIGKEIKEIDEKINNNKLLRESFIEENKNLTEEKKIFSLSEYSEELQNRRKKLLKELDYFSDLMKPMNFVKKKEKISKEYEILNEIDFEDLEKETFRLLIVLQKRFLELINEKTKNIQSKKEMLQFIYLFRYYKLIYINENNQIKDIEELVEEIRKTEKHLITKACKLKTINILCQDIEENYKLISKILSYNIIELEDINLELKKHDKNISLKIYDDEIIEDTIICDANEKLNVKFNRKIKLFS